MPSYMKDKKISIYKTEWTVDDLLQEIEENVMYAENIWAYYRQLSAKESYSAGAAGYKESVLFRINWRDNIDNTMTIKFRDREYNITRIDDFEGYKQDLVIYAIEKEAR